MFANSCMLLRCQKNCTVTCVLFDIAAGYLGQGRKHPPKPQDSFTAKRHLTAGIHPQQATRKKGQLNCTANTITQCVCNILKTLMTPLFLIKRQEQFHLITVIKAAKVALQSPESFCFTQ